MTKVCITVWLVLMCIALAGDFTFAASSASSFTPETNQNLLSAVIQGTRNACESIRSGKGRVAIHQTGYYPDGRIMQRLETIEDVAFSGNKLRDMQQVTWLENSAPPDVKCPIEAGHVERHQVADDGTKTVSFWPEKQSADIAASDIATLRRFSVQFNVWFGVCMKGQHGILDLSIWGQYRPTGYVVNSDGPRIIGREVIDGDECIVVEASLTRSSDGLQSIHRYWVDPSKGYVVPRYQRWHAGGDYKQKTLAEEENIEFRHYADGTWAQAKLVFDHYSYDPKSGASTKLLHSETVYDSSFQVNIPVSDSDLKLTLPSGTHVKDKILGSDYIVP